MLGEFHIQQWHRSTPGLHLDDPTRSGNNENGEDISQAEIGDSLMLKVEVSPGAIYGEIGRASCRERV